MSAADRNIAPSRFDVIFNKSVERLARMGISMMGTRMLAVRGRSSGQWRTTVVNLLSYQGERYLVAPRGVTQWVRNIRVAGEAELRVGRRVERVRVAELADDDKPALLRAYLKRWKFEVGVFFDGVDASASDETLRRIAPGYPVFRVLDR